DTGPGGGRRPLSGPRTGDTAANADARGSAARACAQLSALPAVAFGGRDGAHDFLNAGMRPESHQRGQAWRLGEGSNSIPAKLTTRLRRPVEKAASARRRAVAKARPRV